MQAAWLVKPCPPPMLIRDCWGGVVGDVPVKHVGEHFMGDIVVEFLDLLLNVAKESIARPATDHHDEEDWAIPKEHRHCCSQTDGVCTNLVCCNVE
jgi:hypothetical protein